jgi:branched-subunit amino acid transport protein
MSLNDTLIIAGMALLTFGIRYPLLAVLGKVPLSEPVLSALKYVPVAVLTAIIVPMMVFKNDELALSYTNDYLIAGIVSALVAWRSRNLLLTIILGMGSLLIWRWLLSTHVLR